MEEEKKKKRAWVKDAAIIFLAVLLVLTFFSNTILNRSLPEVATVYVAEGTITNKVRGTGTVTARENYDVTIEQTRKVQSVLVRVGDEVNVGDVLFTLQPGDSDELDRAQDTLKTAERNLKSAQNRYQSWLLSLPATGDYLDLDRRIADCRDALEEACAARDEAVITDADREEYEAKLAEYEAKLAQLEEEIQLQEALVESRSESVESMDDPAGTRLTNRDYELQLSELNERLHEKQVEIRDIKLVLDDANDRVSAINAEWEAELKEANDALKLIEDEINEKFGMGHSEANYDQVKAAKLKYEDAMEATAAAEKELAVVKLAYKEDYDKLVLEATYMEYDDKVAAIKKEKEKKYREDNNIPANQPLTEEQQAEVDKLAKKEIKKLGDRNAYVPKKLSVYMAVIVEKLSMSTPMGMSDPMSIAYDKITAAQEKLDACEDAEFEASEAYDEAYKEYRSNMQDDDEFRRLDSKRDSARAAVNKVQANWDRALEPASASVEWTTEQLKRAQREETDIQNAIEDLKYLIGLNGEDDPNLKYAKDELDAATSRLSELKGEKDTATRERDELKTAMEGREKASQQAEKDVKTCERNLEDALRDLEDRRKSDGKTQAQNALTRQDYQDDIQDAQDALDEARAKVEELSSADNSTEVRAQVAGTVQTLSVSAGHKAEAGNVLATIEVPDLGYSMNFSVTTEQARRLKVGDSATVSNYYWGSQIVATLVSIQTDPQNPQGSRVLNFDVTGDVTAGNSLTIAVGERNANYDMVVPNSAIRSDTNGTFVLMITAKNSPLGNRYFATRVNVEVIASDDQYSAISGAIEAYDSVITTASRNAPISSGDQVRLADSNNS